MGPGDVRLDLESFSWVLQPQEEPLVECDRTAEETNEVQLLRDDAPLQLTGFIDDGPQERVERLGEFVDGIGQLLVFLFYSYWFHGFLYPASKSLRD
jgi:hypothetical protein